MERAARVLQRGEPVKSSNQNAVLENTRDCNSATDQGTLAKFSNIKFLTFSERKLWDRELSISTGANDSKYGESLTRADKELTIICRSLFCEVQPTCHCPVLWDWELNSWSLITLHTEPTAHPTVKSENVVCEVWSVVIPHSVWLMMSLLSLLARGPAGGGRMWRSGEMSSSSPTLEIPGRWFSPGSTSHCTVGELRGSGRHTGCIIHLREKVSSRFLAHNPTQRAFILHTLENVQVISYGSLPIRTLCFVRCSGSRSCPATPSHVVNRQMRKEKLERCLFCHESIIGIFHSIPPGCHYVISLSAGYKRPGCIRISTMIPILSQPVPTHLIISNCLYAKFD